MFERNDQRTIERPAGESQGGRLLFGSGLDPRECGSRGGKASQLSRRLRAQRELEAKVKASKSGYANLALLRIQREDEAALLAERRRADDAVMRADDTVMQLMDWADRERATLAHLKARRRQYEAAVTARFEALEQREQELRERVETDAGLVEWLREVGEERVSQAAGVLGWIEEEPDGVASEA